MRIPLPFCLPFEIVGHRPGQPLSDASEANADAPAARSYLPIQVRRIRRPAWASGDNIGTPNASSINLPGAPTHVSEPQAGGAIESQPVSGSPDNVIAHGSPDAAAATELAQHLHELQAWVDTAPVAEMCERADMARRFSHCWSNPASTSIEVSFKSHLSSLPPMPPHVTDLFVLECPHLSTLPNLSHCADLKTLAVGACNQLTSIPDLSGCPNFRHLHIESCAGITTMPSLSACPHVDDIGFIGCENLRTLPNLAGLTELREFELSFCENLTGEVDVSGCTQLDELTLSGCTNIHSLQLTGCNQLTHVSVWGCSSLNGLPSLGHLQDLRILDLDGMAFSSLPDDIVSLPSTCRVTLDASRLSDAVRNRLAHIVNAPGYAGPQITYSMGQAHGASVAPPVGEAVAGWRAEAPPHLQESLSGFDWQALPTQDNLRAFSSFLVRVRETNDYSHATPELKAATQQRVAALLVQMQTDPALRENCFNLATDAVDSCGDRIAIRLLDMENCAVISEAKTAISAGEYDHNPQSLIDLCKGQHRLDIIAKETVSKVATMHFTDPIEVHLGYLTKLTEPYRLPVRISTMLYPNYSGLTPDDLASVRKKCSNDGLSPAECAANDQAYQHALAGSDLMRGLLERLQPAQMQAAHVETEQRVEQAQLRLYEELDALDPTTANFAQQNRQLKIAFDAIETDIKVQTTLPVLQSFLQTHHLDSALGNA